MKVNQLKIAEFSDVHVHHRNTSTKSILENLTRAFPNTPAFGEYDLIFIAGDFFDGLMNLPDPNVIEIRLWINRFLRQCRKYDVVLRVLEGTPSHDWKQPRLFTHINEMARIGADVAYAETLSIEHIDRFGINVLYVPDEWNPECDDTWVEVQHLLKQHRLEKVDFSVMHGAFHYQLPSHISAPTHDPDRYLSITEYLVFIGHVHRFSQYERIVAAGSFDRLCHGEEEPKGHVEAVVKKGGEYTLTFVENKHAKKYITLKMTGKELDVALKDIRSKVKNLPQDSFVRIEAAKTDAIMVNLDELKHEHPHLRFSSKVDKETEPERQTVIDIDNAYQPIAITRANIEKLLMERLSGETLSEGQITRTKELLDEYIGK